MECPARSADLNPFERVWFELGRRIAIFSHFPQFLAIFTIALQEER